MTSEHSDQPSPQQRREMIAIAAYYLAEQRGFAPGGAERDWLQAEAAIDSMIARKLISRTTATAVGRQLIRNALVLSEDDPG